MTALEQPLRSPSCLHNVLSDVDKVSVALHTIKFLNFQTLHTIKFLNFQTQENCSNQLKFQIKRPNRRIICPKDANRMSNSEDPDQQSDLGLHYLSRPICPKT